MNYLIKNASAVVHPSIPAAVPDSHNRASAIAENSATDIRICQGVIAELGQGLRAMATEETIDASQCVIYPGLINTHHHLAQSILKGVPAGLNQPLGDWLASVPFRHWPHIDAQLMYDAATLGLAEMLRSGATTCCDHHYLYHARVSPEIEDALWQAASDIGVRLVLCRGGATVTGSHRGLRESHIETESIDQMIERIDATRCRYHQPESNAMRRLVVAPTSLVHSTTAKDLKALANYAREHALKLHSHLLEVAFDEEQAQKVHGKSAVDYAGECNWLGEDVWFAHLVSSSTANIRTLADNGTTISHCPTSNCRLGSGIAPVIAMREAGMNITLGVDGSASSESGSMIQELNLAWLLHRSVHGADATRLDDVLQWGSSHAAEMLGLSAIGSIYPGKVADLVLYDISHFRYWGMHSAQWAPILAGEPVAVKTALVNGSVVVSDGLISNIDLELTRERVQQGMAGLLARAL